MNRRISRDALIIFAALLSVSLFLKAPVGALVAWYGAMTGCGLIPLALGPRVFRGLGACAAGFALCLLFSDYTAGERERAGNDPLSVVEEQVKKAATGEQWSAWAVEAVERFATNGVQFPDIGLQANEMPEFARRIGVPAVLVRGDDAKKTPVVIMESGECMVLVGPSNYVDACASGPPEVCRQVYPGVYVFAQAGHGHWPGGDIDDLSSPSLEVDASGANILISWVWNFELEENSSAGTTNWNPVPKRPAVSYTGHQFQMTIPLAAEATYYRLKRR
jgi:hypothetical protein